MRSSPLLLLVILATACGAAPRSSATRDTRVYIAPVALTAGAHYRLRTRTRIVVDGAVVREQELRFGLSPVDIHVLSLTSPRDAETRWADISMTLDDAGVVRRAPVTVCPRADELDATAHAWSVIGNRTQLAGLHAERGAIQLRHELSESPSEATVTVERSSRGTRLYRASGASTTLRGIVVGSLVLDGTLPLSARFATSEGDPLVGRWETIAEGPIRVTDRDHGTTRTVQVRVETDARVERDEAPPPTELSTSCDSGDFDSNAVVRAINTRLSVFTACYERELPQHPDIHGRIVVQLTILEDGSTRGVRIIEAAPGMEAVGACITPVVEAFHFDPGPEGGSVTYSFPFVFEVQQ